MAETFERFEARAKEIYDLDKVLALLGWDEETYLPSGGRIARGKQAGTISAILHQRLTGPELGDAIAAARGDRDPTRAALLGRIVRRRTLAERVPESLVVALAEARSPALAAWTEARQKREFSIFAPHLERLLELVRSRGLALAGGGDPYDALIDESEPGMTRAKLLPIFSRLREALVPLVKRIRETAQRAPEIFRQRFAIDRQVALGIEVATALGFDLSRGRQDRSTHPFCESMSLDDVRLTTRYDEMDLTDALYSTIHETGHGMYEQGFDRAFEGTELARAPSMGIHESQSRLWENAIGRSRAFWEWLLPIAAKLFPNELGQATAEQAYRAVNVVQPSLIRVDADEVTYNLHVMVRFEIEEALIAGQLEARDLPAAWNDKMLAYLGVRPEHDGEGCLQDIHWATAAFGYFPSYTVGNLYAAQLMKCYQAEHPEVSSDVKAGRFLPLLGWLRDKVHRRGQTEDADAIITRVTGRGLDPEPFLSYLGEKFSSR